MTPFQKFILSICFVAGIMISGGFGFRIGEHKGYKQGYSDALTNIKPDTIYVKDTSHYENPEPIEVIPSGYVQVKAGTITSLKEQIAYLEDSLSHISIPDAANYEDVSNSPEVEIALPVEKKIYQDSTYKCQVSGIQPQLDWIETYNTTAYIQVPVTVDKYPVFTLSPIVDALILPESYFIGIGLDLDYHINRWSLSGEGGYGIETLPGQTVRGPYGRVGIKYNLIRK